MRRALLSDQDCIKLPSAFELSPANAPGDTLFVCEQWKTTLPPVDDLTCFLEAPLPEMEKVPITSCQMQDILSPTCKPEDAALLSRISDPNPLLDNILFAVLNNPPAEINDDGILRKLLDDNVFKVLELLAPAGESSYNLSRDITRDLRPDYAFLLGGLCVFRGETQRSEDLKSKMATKIQWAYNPAPYVFGYYNQGPSLTLVAISRPNHGCLPVVRDLASADLKLRKDRIKNVRRLIRMVRLFQALADLVQSTQAEFYPKNMGDCTVELAGRNIIKTYKPSSAQERIKHLRNIYRLLETKGVPNTDRLVYASENTMILSPRGIDSNPKTEEELLGAVVFFIENLLFTIEIFGGTTSFGA